MTTYTVFRQIPGEDGDGKVTWSAVGEFEARDGKAAIEAAVLALPDGKRDGASGDAFAVCATSGWQVLRPKVQTETKVSFA